MKQILTIIVIVLGIITINAQISISTYDRNYYKKPDKNSDYVSTAYYKELSIFTFYDNFSSFTHKTPDMTSFYSINSIQEDEEEEGVFYLTITSDVGNNYTFIMNYNKNELCYVINDEKGKTLLILNIKAKWENDY